MMTHMQAAATVAVLISVWICLAAVMLMQWQIQRYVVEPFKLRLSPGELRQVVRNHIKFFPQSVLRKTAAIGVALLSVSIIATAGAFAFPWAAK
jgi:hypothetical protein